jgi:acetyltransferase-like isoleucine patch superfamily enzyme
MARDGSLLSHLQRFARDMSVRQLAVIWAEEWLGGICRSIPGITGFALRYALYRLLFARLGGFCLIYPGARLSHTYGIRAGRNLAVNSGAFLDGRGGLTLGSGVLVGPNAVLLSSMHHWTDPARPILEQGHLLAETTIGDDVWIGSNVTINPGLTIATGTVVGAGAVVTSDTQPYSIVGGVPARQIGSRPVPAERRLASSST